MKGTITSIIEKEFGWEYGFINANGIDYYFDNRYLSEGSMKDFYQDDIVDFQPDKNPHTNQNIAIEIKLEIGDLKGNKSFSSSYSVIVEPDYSMPDQIESNGSKWYKEGRSQKLILRGFSKEEIIILDKMKEILYHTNAGHFKTREKGINYGYGLFGPTKQFSLRLGLEKVEFAIIFCDQAGFQRRTLEETFIFLTRQVIPKVRISGHFFLLATKYKNIIEQIEKPEIQGALPYSIIPFTYDELINTQISEYEKFFLNRFQKYLFERDFFSYTEPINDRLFLFGGREKYAKSIADRSISGDHSGIFGLRKSGKTSVINMIKQELEQRSAFYISYRSVEFSRHSWYEAICKIIKDIYIKLGIETPSIEYNEINTVGLFTEDILKVIYKANNHIVLILDEIEQISVDSTFDEKWQNSISFHLFWSTIITFCEKHPGVLSLIIAGINPSINEMDILPADAKSIAPRNPLYKKLSNDSYLKPFIYEQTKRMVNVLGKYMGYNFDDEVCFELQTDFGGHPYFTRQMCKSIIEFIRNSQYDNRQEPIFTVTRPLYNAVKEAGEYKINSIQWCKDILRELQVCFPDEFKLLLNIANKDTSTIENIRRSITIIPHLIGYGLIRFDDISCEMEISIEVVRDYLVNEKVYKKPYNEMSRNEVDEEIQDGISLCEIPLRKLIKDVVLTQLSRSEASEFIWSTPSYARANKNINLSGYDIQKLLDPRCVTLQFYMLKDIICGQDPKFKNHYELFKNKLYPYTRSEVDSYLSNIYVARNTADHHFEIHNEGTLLNFRASVAEISKLLKEHEYID